MEIFQDGELEAEMRRLDYNANSLSSIWHLFATSYEEAIKSLATPVRATYIADDLGPKELVLSDDGVLMNPEDDAGSPCAAAAASASVSAARHASLVQREDLELYNCRGEALKCSFWRKTPPLNHRKTPPCIVYLHGISSSRKECVYIRDRVLSAGFSLFALDLSGSGLSDGDRMSYGFFEKDDLRVVLDYLFATASASSVGIWGRCLGGATALLHLRDSMDFSYKTISVPKTDAHRLLHIGMCKHTGRLMCVRPSRLFPFRMTQVSANNGDFVILSVGQKLVHGLSVEQCRRLIDECPDDVVRIAGYEHSQGVSGGVINPFIFGLALDSTFGDMEQVISDMFMEVCKSAEKRNVSFPSAMITAASKIISRSVRKSAGYSFKDIYVLDDLPQFQLPCIFTSTSKLDFIRPDHTRAIYERYGGEKTWISFEGGHDENRPEFIVDAVLSFLLSKWKQV
ncbi:hypothetical protein PINS_up001364 [Pythium insidiosum]|nr:hypothetical protein PINS_up001364 [Pythium insidiosum]